MGILKKDIDKKVYIVSASATFFGILLIWSIISFLSLIKPFFLPSPYSVLKSLTELILKHNYLLDVWVSTYRIVWGFILSVLIGVPIGVLIGVNRRVESFIEPLINFIRYMPVAGFVPLCILWLGIGDIQKIAIIFIGTFFQLVPMVMHSVSRVPLEYIETSRALGLKDFKILRRVILPFSYPNIYDSIRVSIGISWTYLVVAEIVGASSGIGHVIIQSQRYLQTSSIFVGIASVGFLGMITDFSFKFYKPKLFPWLTSSVR